MDTPSDVCFQRILSRDRADEKVTMTQAYVELQREKYVNLFENIFARHEEINVHYYNDDSLSVISAIRDQVHRNSQ
jgi:hypothetical protein